MKLIFAGTPDFAAAALSALAAAGHDIPLVLTQPDRPAGRGMKLKPSAVKARALELGLRVEQPLSLRNDEARAMLRAVEADVMVVAAYGLILPQAVLDLPRLGCLNIHASILPRWRGAAPIQRAILAGDAESGVTIMQMEAGLDTGPMRHVVTTPIGTDDTAASLHDRLMALGASAIVDVLADPDRYPPVIQPEAGVTYAQKLSKEEAGLDWRLPAAELDRRVRGYCPVPGAWTRLGGETLKVWAATPVAGSGTPGMVIAADRHGLTVACGEGALCITSLQPAGGKRLEASAFVAGRPGLAGQQLG
ncbi:methionyl-tRNA formyltransferase [Laribacter hongkongensis]|uniref:methionyl-tRNA formyltransferase n=1 Tax=Laribacter hongkongensis TaxID=168471 RepID=UPI001EFC8879|nr:methionyl-tRNA formyltransferase [Laribacter hongkongensis]MCG9107638.1 methionyl-tRNA formyltransferase [Laribacter hongkongensis]